MQVIGMACFVFCCWEGNFIADFLFLRGSSNKEFIHLFVFPGRKLASPPPQKKHVRAQGQSPQYIMLQSQSQHQDCPDKQKLLKGRLLARISHSSPLKDLLWDRNKALVRKLKPSPPLSLQSWTGLRSASGYPTLMSCSSSWLAKGWVVKKNSIPYVGTEKNCRI